MTNNRNYKDTLFRLIFSNPRDLLNLYNAINNTDYTDETLLQITTLEDAIYIGVKNDISFIISQTMSLYEHQSSNNPNMPIRGLLYFSKLYQQYIDENNLNVYGSKLIFLPPPKYIVFCNYESMIEERQILRLSDSFTFSNEHTTYSLECIAELVNINFGHNSELMQKCQKLSEYAQFIHEIRSATKKCKTSQEAANAIEKVVKDCISKGILSDILRNNYNGVSDMLLEEFDQEKYLELMRRDIREDAFAEGHAEGFANGRAEGFANGHAEGHTAGLAEGLAEAINRFITNSLCDGSSKELIINHLQKYFNLDETQANLYYDKCSHN